MSNKCETSGHIQNAEIQSKSFRATKYLENQETSFPEQESATSEDSWSKRTIENGRDTLKDFKSILEQHENFMECNVDYISKFVVGNTNSLSNVFSENCGTQMFDSFPVREPRGFLAHQSDISKSGSLSLFKTDGCFTELGNQKCNEKNSSERNPKMQIHASQSFQCVSAQAFSSKQVTHTLSGQASKISHFRNSDLSSFQHTTNSSDSQTVSEQNAVSHKFASRRSFEYFGKSNAYKFSSHSVGQMYHQGYESVSESDDEEEEDETGTEIPYNSREAIEYSLSGKSPAEKPLLMIEYDVKKEKLQQTLHKIALELLTTERTYVSILNLLDQVFAFRVDQENRVHGMFPQEVVSQMFMNLKSLYKLHHDFLLPRLEERMAHWEGERRIGDIMKNFAPFLKMYTEYVKNYDNAMSLINMWYQKHQRFAQIMDGLHVLEECKQLTLQHHMLTPVQRVPRYQLLLQDYLKKLPDDSSDKTDTEKALELVSIAANHANDSMKKIDKFKKLLEIQEMIGGSMDLVSPSRELLKEGKIIKISARSGDHQERYIFLFSDLLLLCSQRLLPNKVVSGPCFRVRARLDVYNLLVEEGDNLETANTFYLHTTGRLIELYTPTLEGKIEWIKILTKAVSDLAEKKSSLKVNGQEAKVPGNSELGARAPNFVKLESVTHCMACEGPFSTFTFRRKHHCHACGIVACNKCLSNKVQLPYEKSKSLRICSSCYDALVKDMQKSEVTEDRPRSVDVPQRQKGVLDVNPGDPSVMSGYLQLKARHRFWVRRWFALHDDFVLYSFNVHTDEMALTSMPVPGYTIGLPDKNDNVDGRENVFKLFHKKKMYFFQTSDQLELQRWVSALDKASRAESFS